MARPLPKSEIFRAAERYRAFHGDSPETVEAVPMKTVAFALGDCISITYKVIENGRETLYQHEFDRPPALAISSDGRQAFILGGEWTFTKRGFEG